MAGNQKTGYHATMHSLIRLLVLLFLATPSLGQSTSGTPAQQEELDRLFGTLRDENLGTAAISTEQRIWQIWMSEGTPQQNNALQSAAVAMGAGQFRLSEEILNQLIAQKEIFPEIYNKRATLYYLMGKYEESLADIVTTLELEPRHFGAMSGRGMIYQKIGKEKEALEAYREALSVNPHLPGATIAINQLEKNLPDL